MPDLIVLGSGPFARECGHVFAQAGLDVRRAFQAEPDERCPLVVGEVPDALHVAWTALYSGRHVLLGSRNRLSSEVLGWLLPARRPSQALCFWSERLYHPAYNLLGTRVRADGRWRPHFLRLDTLTRDEPQTVEPFVIESLAVLLNLAGTGELEVLWANTETRDKGPGIRSLSAGLLAQGTRVHLSVGLGHALERRELLLVAGDAQAFVDELGTTPLRMTGPDGELLPVENLLVGADLQSQALRARCVSFIAATTDASKAAQEAELWQAALYGTTAITEFLADPSRTRRAQRRRLNGGPDALPGTVA